MNEQINIPMPQNKEEVQELLKESEPYKAIENGKEVEKCPECHTTIIESVYPINSYMFARQWECPGCGAYWSE